VSTTRALRAERFDVAIDLMGSDHASTAAWLSGAKRRLVRRPGPRRPRFAWRWFATDLIDSPFGQEADVPAALALPAAGRHPLRRAGLRAAARPALGLAAGRRGGDGEDTSTSVPFTKQSCKELPPAQLVELLLRLREGAGRPATARSPAPARARAARARRLAARPAVRALAGVAGTLDIPAAARADRRRGPAPGRRHRLDAPCLAGGHALGLLDVGLRQPPHLGARGRAARDGLLDVPPGEHLLGVSTEAVVARSLELSRRRPASIGVRGSSTAAVSFDDSKSVVVRVDAGHHRQVLFHQQHACTAPAWPP
jgi:hypothetical protein